MPEPNETAKRESGAGEQNERQRDLRDDQDAAKPAAPAFPGVAPARRWGNLFPKTNAGVYDARYGVSPHREGTDGWRSPCAYTRSSVCLVKALSSLFGNLL